MNLKRLFLTCIAFGALVALADEALLVNEPGDGYRGVWYQNQRLGGEYVYKYSGGLGTYCAKHKPFAVYRLEVNKTFFCYGGVDADYHVRHRDFLSKSNVDKRTSTDAIHHMVGVFDHASGELSRPTILLNKATHDAHDNPVIAVDDAGHIWIFSTAHGTMRLAYVHRSRKPYDISEFEAVQPYRLGEKTPIRNFSYMQAWHVPDEGFSYFFTSYQHGRMSFFASSLDGIAWTVTQTANIQLGHYQISVAKAGKAATAFNYHPHRFRGDAKRKGLNWRTNLYYMETCNRGETWQSAAGTELQTPLTDPQNAALVHDFESKGKLVYMKDIQLDAEGRPHILFLTANGYVSGPASGPRQWQLARWSGERWQLSTITTSDNNYDMGSLYLEAGARLRVIAPTETGPQAFNPGGEIAIWESGDVGQSWHKTRQLTMRSPHNHGYVRRPVNAHPDFYGFWAAGHGREPSASALYFCNAQGDVFQLPAKMEQLTVRPPRLLRAD